MASSSRNMIIPQWTQQAANQLLRLADCTWPSVIAQQWWQTNARAHKTVQLYNTSAQRAEERQKQFGRAQQQNKC
jgi:hypothetical protein